jgi:NAD(P)-dependent dehydrogenase (short-subunit alcohol dehydrogenase family)
MAAVSDPATRSPAARTVLVTGGARRLGREICLQFARAGWNVAVHYRRSADEAQALQHELDKLGCRAFLIAADLGEPDAAERVLSDCEQQTGAPPDCIVNNASLFQADDALSATPAHLRTHWSINTATPLLLANGLARRLLARKQPAAGRYSVVHVLDQKVHNLNPDYFSYTVSKLALAQSAAWQAQALAPWVRVCGLSPGLLYPSGPQTQDNFERAGQVNLLRQPVAPADVARCALFIAENVSLNGTILQADNGQHLVGLNRDVMFAVDGADPTGRPGGVQ